MTSKKTPPGKTRTKTSTTVPRGAKPKVAPKKRASAKTASKPSTPAEKPAQASIPTQRQEGGPTPAAFTDSQGERELWEIIDRVRARCQNQTAGQREAWRAELEGLTDEALQRAVIAFNDAMRRAHDWGLWGAAYLIHGGCSDDGFWDFRAGLIAMGRDVYEQALRQPDSLAAIEDVANRTLSGGFQSVPRSVLTARNLTVTSAGQHAKPPSGTAWGEDEELETLYPRLAARFADAD